MLVEKRDLTNLLKIVLYSYEGQNIHCIMRTLSSGRLCLLERNHISLVPLMELAKLMLELTGKDLRIICSEPRKGDILHSYADIFKAKEILGFNPKYDQESGLRDYFEWYGKKYNTKILKS